MKKGRRGEERRKKRRDEKRRQERKGDGLILTITAK